MERIVEVLKNHELGLFRVELEGLLEPEWRGQRLLRALRKLEQEGRVRFEGNTKARRYFAAQVVAARALPTSSEADAVLAALRRPLHERAPVSYRREFLDAYVPGKTFYLPAETRTRLAALGRTPEDAAPAGTYARKVLERFLLDLSWSSAALEGNTYSLLDTERLFQQGREAGGKTPTETQMLLNHKAAIEYLVDGPASLDERMVKSLHALLMENLLSSPLDEGRLRASPVQIGQSVYLPLANPPLLAECFAQLLATARAIEDAFECAFFLLVQLPYLQPFLDGNKRTARLAANIPFVLRNLVPLSFIDVPRDVFSSSMLAVYELNRIEPLRDVFTWAYERSTQRLGQVRTALGEPDVFRMKHREALRAVVRALVQGLVAPTRRRGFIEDFAARQVAAEDRERFALTAERELLALSEATFARYGLRPAEYEAWAAVHGSA